MSSFLLRAALAFLLYNFLSISLSYILNLFLRVSQINDLSLAFLLTILNPDFLHVDSLEKTLMLGGIGGRKRRGRQGEMAGWHH